MGFASFYLSAKTMVIWLRPFSTRVARHIARGRHLRMFLVGALSTNAVSTKRLSTSTLGLWVLALATVLPRTTSAHFLGGCLVDERRLHEETIHVHARALGLGVGDGALDELLDE